MVAGGASQSAANYRAGARTQAAGLLVAVLALVTALFLTPLFFYLPEAVLGAIVLFAIMGFFRTGELRRIARLSRLSFIGALVALIGVLVLGVPPGLMLAVGLSIVMLLTRAARPGLSLLGRDPAGVPPDGALPAVYGDLTQNEVLRPVPGLLIVRPNAPLFFGNVRAVRQQVLDLARRDGAPAAGDGPLPAAAGRGAGPGPAAGHPDEPEHRHRDGGHPRPAAHHPGRRRALPVARRWPRRLRAHPPAAGRLRRHARRGAHGPSWPAPSTPSSTGRRKRRRRRAGLSSS